MKLTIVGGGGFRVPQMFEALSADPAGLVSDLVLVDVDEMRLGVVDSVIRGLPHTPASPRVRVTTDAADGLAGADVVFSAMRVGGTAGRVADEEVALAHGVLGQETVGVGGIAYALRTVPAARTLAHLIAAHAPAAWVINFTNPAGVITQAMREVLGDRVIGICDTPIGLVHRLEDVTGARIDAIDYVGINHLGWLRGATAGGRDVLGEALADPALLARIEEAELFGADVVRSIGALPNEYLFYYTFAREALARVTGRVTRGAYLDSQQRDFYREASAAPERAAELWTAALAEREETYGAEAREDPASRRDAHEIALGGYQAVALTLMRTLAGAQQPSTMILDVANLTAAGRAIPQLADDAVVEIPCLVDADGVHPRPGSAPSAEMAGLMVSVKACDELVLAATRERDPILALRAIAAHPLVDSLATARRLLADYCARIPGVAAAIGAPPVAGE